MVNSKHGKKLKKEEKKEKIQKYKNKNKMCRGGGNLHYLLRLISNTLPQLE